MTVRPQISLSECEILGLNHEVSGLDAVYSALGLEFFHIDLFELDISSQFILSLDSYVFYPVTLKEVKFNCKHAFKEVRQLVLVFMGNDKELSKQVMVKTGDYAYL